MKRNAESTPASTKLESVADTMTSTSVNPPRRRRGAVIELVHWIVGATLGLLFGLLPERLRLKPWAGPAFGLLAWFGFDAVAAPALGLKQRRWPHGAERAVFLVDHLLFGLVLSELRSRPRE